MQCREVSIMAHLSDKQNSEVVNLSVSLIGKRHSTNQNEIAV